MSRSIDPAVYENYLKGRFQLNKGGRAAIGDSVRYFEKAIAGDPQFAQAFIFRACLHRHGDDYVGRISHC